ncbi:MAG TPA: hypothetical protein VI874_03900 [Candidatus Norongarragalinales archaeon]|nr:hypothetical protein [Candidatus Norongarragalinales archaeon]
MSEFHTLARQAARIPSADHGLTVKRMRQYHNFLCKRFPPVAGNLPFQFYDFGHVLIREHLLQAVQRRMPTLSKTRLKQVRRLIGRVFYHPPAREYVRRLNALKQLDPESDLGYDVYAILRTELRLLKDRDRAFKESLAQKIVEPDQAYLAIFTNPLSQFWETKLSDHKRNLESNLESARVRQRFYR